jgi:tetratricopeptide (TPR) repeat protein
VISKTRSSEDAASNSESGPGASAAPEPHLSAVLGASSPCLAGERVAFTGTLASMTHQQAHDLAQKHGGTSTQHVSRQTTMLIVGEEGWPLEPDGRPSLNMQDASRLQQEGLPLRIVSESDWLRLLGLDGRCREVHALYTPAMLSRSLDVPIGTIRRWERLGLIRPVKKVFRLPYFDYAEAAGVRRLNELLNAGVPRSQLEASLAKIRHLLPGIERPLAQLNLLAQDSRLVARDDHGLFEPTTGQRCFDFSPMGKSQSPPLPHSGRESADSATEDEEASVIAFRIVTPQSADATGPPSPGESGPTDARANWSGEQWFAEGCRHLDAHRPEAAIEAFRLGLMNRPDSPEIHFHLAESLFRVGRADAALERYYAAVEGDHNYLEAWMQIGALLATRGELEPALDALKLALSVHADYPDAHWHAADVLLQLGRTEEAAYHWRSYLKFDTRGPWADEARQRLEEIGETGV